MKKSLRLPSDFLDSLNEGQNRKVKLIEDRIEQSWRVVEIVLSLNVINGIAGPTLPPPMSREAEQLLQEMAENATHLAHALGVDNEEDKSQFDIDRMNIWNAVRRYGNAVVLSFIDIQLVTNIEKLFAGIVVAYVAMFNSGKRETLSPNKVFANRADLKVLHTRLYGLRNEWYAHVERENGRHTLRYRVNEHGEIEIDKKGEQITPEYHLSEFVSLFKCVNHVSTFIDKDIDERINDLMETLTAPQRETICRHWNRGNVSAELGQS